MFSQAPFLVLSQGVSDLFPDKILSNRKLFLSLRPLCSVGIANLLSINHLNVQDGHTELQNGIPQGR